VERLHQAMSAVFKLDASTLPDDAGMKQVPAWDSLTHLDLIAKLEETFRFELTGDEIAEMRTVGDIRRIVGSRSKE